MAADRETIMRGWNESGMGRAMDLAHNGAEFDRSTAEFKEALSLQAQGLLFENFTDKTKANKVEAFMTTRFQDLFDLEEEDNASATAEAGVAVRPEESEPAIESTQQYALFQTLKVQGAAIICWSA